MPLSDGPAAPECYRPGLVFTFSEPWIGSGKPPGLIIIMRTVGTYFAARDINRHVKKEEEEKRQAVEQPVQESVEERAQAPVEEHAEEEQ